VDVSRLREDRWALFEPFPYQDIAALQAWLDQQPWHGDAWHQLGHYLQTEGALDEALDAYSQAITIAHRFHPLIHFEHSLLHLTRAQLYDEAGIREEVQAECRASLFQDHDNPAALALQAGEAQMPAYTSHTWFAVDYVCAIRRQEISADALPDWMQRHDAALSDWLERDTPVNARETLNQLVRRFPQDHRLWLHLALLARALGDTDAAWHALEQALSYRHISHRRYHAHAALHYYHRGVLHEQMAEPVLARMDYIRASDIDTGFQRPKDALQRLTNP
jgi:tetratricopeptide (TPR) repeat protein